MFWVDVQGLADLFDPALFIDQEDHVGWARFQEQIAQKTACFIDPGARAQLQLQDLPSWGRSSHGASSSQGNDFMARDAWYLRHLSPFLAQMKQRSLDGKEEERAHGGRDALLHLYRWTQIELSLGCFSQKERFVKRNAPSERICTRPTGGGAMLHGSDLCFSLILPSSHKDDDLTPSEHYARYHALLKQWLEKVVCDFNTKNGVAEELFSLAKEKGDFLGDKRSTQSRLRLGACYSELAPFDGLCRGKKIWGSALRRCKQAALHQFSIQLFSPWQSSDASTLDRLLPRAELDSYFERCTFLFDQIDQKEELKRAGQRRDNGQWHNKIMRAIVYGFTNHFSQASR